MQAITVRDRNAGLAGMSLTDMPYPHAAENDVIVRVHAAGFTPGELDWPATWTDRAGRDRTPSVPGHELSGVVVELGFGTTGLRVGQRVFGLADWTRHGSLAEYAVTCAEYGESELCGIIAASTALGANERSASHPFARRLRRFNGVSRRGPLAVGPVRTIRLLDI